MPDQLKPPEEMTPEEAYAEALARIEAAEHEQWTELKLYDLPLRELPPEIGRLTRLTALYLSYVLGRSKTSLVTLPSEIGQLTQLQLLDLGHNNLIELPPEIGQLTQLQELNLS